MKWTRKKFRPLTRIPPPKKTPKCPVCGLKFEDYLGLTMHIVGEHWKTWLGGECRGCQNRFGCIEYLGWHIQELDAKDELLQHIVMGMTDVTFGGQDGHS